MLYKKELRFFCFTSFTLILLLISIIPIRLAIAFCQAPLPQAILTLGADPNREKFTAQFAQMHPSLEVWVSSGSPSDKARKIFQTAGIPNVRVHIDHRAVDTVTNFTSLVKDFKKRNFQHLYLITEDFHMPRAKVIATLVLGSQGITFTPISIPSKNPPESWMHILRDIGRALTWISTGFTGASLKPQLQSHASRQLYPWHLYSWRSPLETTSLVLSWRSTPSHSPTPIFCVQSLDSSSFWSPNWSTGKNQAWSAGEVSLAVECR